MALVEATLRANLKNLFDAMKDSPMTEDDFAGRMSRIINDHIRTATVTVMPGIAVATPAGPGATTAPGTGSLS